MASQFQKHMENVNKEAARRRKIIEQAFLASHRHWSNDQLLDYLAAECRRIGRRPKLLEVVGYRLLLDRFDLQWGQIVALAQERNAAKARENPEGSRRDLSLGAAAEETGGQYPEAHGEAVEAKLRRIARDRAFAAEHSGDTDEELLAYLRQCAGELGHSPTKAEVVGAAYIKERFVYWNIALTLAGLPMPTGTLPPSEQDLCDYRTGRLRERAEAKRRKQKTL